MPGSTRRKREGSAGERRIHYSREEEDLLTKIVQSQPRRPNWDNVAILFNEDKDEADFRTAHGLQSKWRKMQKDTEQSQGGLGLTFAPTTSATLPSVTPASTNYVETVFYPQNPLLPQAPARSIGGVPLQLQGQIPPQQQDQVPLQLQGQMPPQQQGQVPPQLQGQMPPQLQGQVPLQLQGQMPPQLQGQVPPQLQGQMPPQLQGQVPLQLQGGMYVVQGIRGNRIENRVPWPSMIHQSRQNYRGLS